MRPCIRLSMMENLLTISDRSVNDRGVQNSQTQSFKRLIRTFYFELIPKKMFNKISINIIVKFLTINLTNWTHNATEMPWGGQETSWNSIGRLLEHMERHWNLLKVSETSKTLEVLPQKPLNPLKRFWNHLDLPWNPLNPHKMLINPLSRLVCRKGVKGGGLRSFNKRWRGA